ncbi:hypothetical protein GCM10007858_59880 [Bradyrhizobium liaoningense]|nr:hypothetical protein GCM10007858_59880 [Bradyrhizobium liaoningense]
MQMTNEAIKALMIFAMYGILELALYFSSITRSAQAIGALDTRPDCEFRFHPSRGGGLGRVPINSVASCD